MKTHENAIVRDFSIIFKKIENYTLSDSSIKDNIVDEEELKQEESIRKFSEMCNEIRDIENNSIVFMTFT